MTSTPDLPPSATSTRVAIEESDGVTGSDRYILRLYVAGMTARSARAVEIKKIPWPLRRLIGDMSSEDRILIGLDLVPRP